jgi:predicted nucleic acid-binding protein
MTFLDTGILVGAVLQTHSQHLRCLAAVEDCELPFTNAHALAETFATLTGFYKVPTKAAAELTLALREIIQVKPLALEDYVIAISEAQSRGVMGGGIYDSLHATFARRNKTKQIATLNPSHFHHAAPDIPILTP